LPKHWKLGVELAKRDVIVLMVAPLAWGGDTYRADFGVPDKWGLLHVPVENSGDIFSYTMREAWESIQKFQPDWIFSDSEPCAAQSVLSLKWARKLGCKLACFSWENVYKTYGGSRSRVEQKVLASSDAVIVGNEGARQALIKKSCSPEKIFKVLETGIDTEMYHLMPVEKRYDCLFLGRRVMEKGVEVIDEALLGSQVKMVWVGRGGYSPKHGEVRGYLPEEDLPETYNSAKVFLYPSIPVEGQWAEQGFYSGLEALACGTPAIATTSGAIPELVGDCEAAHLISPNNAEELKDSIQLVLRLDDKTYWAMQTKASRFILERYSLPVTAKKYLDVFRT
jgi:glycosyltransferase involved in cell wall biosynthesis